MGSDELAKFKKAIESYRSPAIELITKHLEHDEEFPDAKAFSEILKKSKFSNLFQKFISDLEIIILSEDMDLRRRGIESFSMVLQAIPNDMLNAKQILPITDFYCNRMLDHHSIIPGLLTGLVALVKMKHFPDMVAARIFRVINFNVTCQSQSRNDRHNIYRILNILIKKKCSELKLLGSDFIFGYLYMIESESDPRNLLYLFQHLPTFFQKFPPGGMTEHAFEVIECYFPIDYRDNPKTLPGVTRDKLVEELNQCMTCIDEFAPLTIDVALDKLDSDFKVAKIESLILLDICINKFQIKVIRSKLKLIEQSLIREVRPENPDREVRDLAIDVLSDYMRVLSATPELLTTAMIELFDAYEHHLLDIRYNLFMPTVELLVKLQGASKEACLIIVNKVLYKFMTMGEDQECNRVLTLKQVTMVLEPCEIFRTVCDDEEDISKDIIRNWEEILSTIFRYGRSSNPELKSAAFRCLTSIAKLLTKKERDILVDVFRYEFTDIGIIPREQTYEYLRKFVTLVPEDTYAICQSIKYVLLGSSNVENPEHVKRYFECVCTVAVINSCILADCIKRYMIGISSVIYLECIRNFLESEKHNERLMKNLHHNKVTLMLMDWLYQLRYNKDDEPDFKLIGDSFTTTALYIYRSIGTIEQLKLGNFFIQNIADLIYKENPDDASTTLHPLHAILLEPITVGIQPSSLQQLFKDNKDYFGRTLLYSFNTAIYSKYPYIRLKACKCVTSMVVKLDDYGLQKLSNALNEYLTASAALPYIEDGSAAIMLLHIIKGMATRGFKNLNNWLDVFLTLMDDTKIGSILASNMTIFSTEDDLFLNPWCYFTIKLFYRQRLFSYLVPKLLMKTKTDNDTLKQNCAITILHLLDGVHQSVSAPHFKEIIPLLVEFLENEDSELVHAVLRLLEPMISSSPLTFERYVETFIPKFVGLSKTGTSMKIRMLALDCLCEYSKLETSTLIKFKDKVIRDIAPCLDDRKRLVRQSAIKMRTLWYRIGV